LAIGIATYCHALHPNFRQGALESREMSRGAFVSCGGGERNKRVITNKGSFGIKAVREPVEEVVIVWDDLQ
jgi:hypothetical protein